MVFGFGKKKERFVVATVLVAVDGDAVAAVRERAKRATDAIVAADGDFDVASAEVEGVARVLLDHQIDWTHAALGGDVVDDEASASDAVDDVYADLAGRYLADEHGADNKDVVTGPGDRRVVVVVTVAYAGENADIERDLNDRGDVDTALRAIAALHQRDALLAAQVHVAPAHPEDLLTDEQLLVCFPELMVL